MKNNYHLSAFIPVTTYMHAKCKDQLPNMTSFVISGITNLQFGYINDDFTKNVVTVRVKVNLFFSAN